MLFWKRLCRPQGEPPAPLAASSPSTTATSSSTLQRIRKFCIYIYIFLHKHFAIVPRPFHYKRPRGACLYVLNMHTKSKKLWKRDKKCVCVCLDFYSVFVLGIWFFWVCFFFGFIAVHEIRAPHLHNLHLKIVSVSVFIDWFIDFILWFRSLAIRADPAPDRDPQTTN